MLVVNASPSGFRKWPIAAFLLVLFILCVSSPAISRQAHLSDVIEKLDITAPDFSSLPTHGRFDIVTLPGPQPVTSAPVPRQRLHFADIDDQSKTDYEIIIYNSNEDILDRIPKSVFRSRSNFWTTSYFASEIVIAVEADTAPAGLRFRISERLIPGKPGAPQSIIGATDDRQQLHEFESEPRVIDAAAAVVRLNFKYQHEGFSCTGFMIDDDVMVTNAHCLPHHSVCRSMEIWFGYELRAGQTEALPIAKTKCRRVLHSPNRTLDFTYLQITPPPKGVQRVLEFEQRTPENEQLYLIHHPEGRPKMVTKVNCMMTTIPSDAGEHAFGHSCDSSRGSSGAPVLTTDMKVIGLHFYGHELDHCDACENQATKSSYLP